MHINIKHGTLIGLLLILIILPVKSQIVITNPSFEDQPADATVPQGWLPCAMGTTPDILPGFWGEYGEAHEGETYIGLITRQDGSFESIGQRLSHKIKDNSCYSFKINLAKGKDYIGFDKPLRLKIWIGTSICEKKQLVYTSALVKNSDWIEHIIEFESQIEGQYLILEAFHSDKKEDYKGNILLDDMSYIFVCNRV